jgi:hypothetical protein
MIGKRLRDYWLSQDIEINPGLSDEGLRAFEARYQVSLSADLRDYFLTVNGMAEGVSDNALIRFWSLNEIKPIPEEDPTYGTPSYIQDAQSFFVFADYCIWSHAYAIRLALNPETSNQIVVIGAEAPITIFNSFSELVSSYLDDPDSLLTNL